jgi:hypothetical protein
VEEPQQGSKLLDKAESVQNKRQRRNRSKEPNQAQELTENQGEKQQSLGDTRPQEEETTVEEETPTNPPTEDNPNQIRFPDNTKLMSTGLITPQEFIEAQRVDATLEQAHLNADNPASRKYSYRKGVLCHHKGNGKRCKPILPAKLFTQYLYSAHYNRSSGHRSAQQIVAKIQDAFFIHNLEKKVKDFEATCYYCQVFRSRRNKAPPFLESLQAQQPRQIWSVDYAFGFVTAGEKKEALVPEEDHEDKGAKTAKNKESKTKRATTPYTGVLIFLDNATLYTQIIAVKSKRSTEFLEVLDKHIVKAFTVPQAIRSDREACIRSKEVQEYMDNLGIKHLPTAASSAWSNGQIENHISKIKTVIATNYHQCPL